MRVWLCTQAWHTQGHTPDPHARQRACRGSVRQVRSHEERAQTQRVTQQQQPCILSPQVGARPDRIPVGLSK